LRSAFVSHKMEKMLRMRFWCIKEIARLLLADA
jgi:hypothetical protein